MKREPSNNKNEISVKQAARVLVLLFGVISVLSGFEHYEKSGQIGMTAAYIVFGVCCLGWVILSFLDDRRERIRKEKLEDAKRIAEILSAPLSKYSDDKDAYEKALDALEKKYGK